MRKNSHYISNYFRIIILINVFFLSPLMIYGQSNNEFSKKDLPVEGIITDISGSPLMGVTVMVKGTSIGTITDQNGHFFLNVPDYSMTLKISFIGYKSKEIKAKSKLIVELEEENVELQDVVVVAYGTQKKTSLTAAVSSVKSSDIINKPVSNVSTALAGRVAGLLTAQSSGEVGKDNTDIFIRGISTIGNSSPLIVVDGVPRNTLNQLDPNTIESISILKDAAAVAPYGIGGANGVILVTTKQGKNEKPKISYDGFVSFQNPTTIMKMMNSYEYVTTKNAAIHNQNPFAKPPYSDKEVQYYQRSVEGDPTVNTDLYPNTNAYEEIRNKNTPFTHHNISITGGNEFIKAFASLGYQYQEGMWSTANSSRYNLTSNVEMKATKTTSVNFSLNGWNQINRSPGMDGTAISNAAIGYLPTRKIRFSNGLLSHNNGIIVDTETGKNTSDLTRIMAQITLNQDLSFITKGLNFKAVGSYDPTTNKIKSWGEPRPTYYDAKVDPNDSTKVIYTPYVSTGSYSLSLTSDYQKEYTGQLMLNYEKSFGDHSISGLFVYEIRHTTHSQFYASRINYNFGIDELNYGGENPEDKSNGGYSSEAKQIGYVFRGTYNYQDKYLLELSGRYDGHYYFAPKHRFGFFPAASIGWRMSEEKFIKDNLSFVNNLKLRISYGQSGNLAGGPFQYSSSMTINPLYDQNYNLAAYFMDGKAYPGVAEAVEPNPLITWEKANKLNTGIDINLWNSLFEMQFDYFYEKRNNMLVTKDQTVPVEYAIPLAQVNEGVMNNKGIDFTIGSRNNITKDLNYNLSVNFTYAKNKLLEIYENPFYRNDPNRSRTGKPLNTRFGLKSLGLFQIEDFDVDANGKYTLKAEFPTQTFSVVKPGDIRYEDINRDGKITTDDETNIGYPAMPEIVYGINAGINYDTHYGIFDINILFQGTGHSQVMLGQEVRSPFYDSKINVAKVALDYWTPENPNAQFPRIFPGGGALNNQQISDFYMRNNSYLRLKNLEIGYTLPKQFVKSLSVEKIRLYYSGQNLFTYAPDLKELMDPEMISSSEYLNARGWSVPQQRVNSIGLSISF